MRNKKPKRRRSKRNSRSFETSPFFNFGEVSNFSNLPEMAEISPESKSGSLLAINYITSGVGVLSVDPVKRGAARNRADRESHVLKAAQIGNLIAAEHHAAIIGLPFTRMITIHWEAAGVPLAGMAKATGRFIDLMSKALSRHGCATAWLWVHENGDGKGGHCHLLIHVPSHLVKVVVRLQMGWLRKITGKPYKARVIHSKPIGRRLGLEVGNPALHAVNLEAAFSYFLKQTDGHVASQLGLNRLEDGGRVIGKRCATSQNIGRKARQQDGNE